MSKCYSGLNYSICGHFVLAALMRQDKNNKDIGYKMNTATVTNAKKSNAKKSSKAKKTVDTSPVVTAPIPVPVNITAKALTNTAMLCKVKISKFIGRLNDKDMTASTAAANNIDNSKKVVSVVKRILRSDELNSVVNTAQKITKYHKQISRPWLDGGIRCFPSMQFPVIKTELDKLTEEFNTGVEKFLGAIQTLRNNDRSVLGSAFDITDYPNVDELRAKYKVHVEYMPIATADDFRVQGLSEETLNELRDNMEKAFADRMKEGDAELLERLLNGDAPAANANRGNGLRNLLYRLTVPNDKGEIGFKQTSLDNIREFADQAVALNIGNNKCISDICAKLKTVFNIEADTLRENETALKDKAQETADSIKEIENAMQGLV